TVVVEHAAHRQLILNDRQVDHGRDAAVGIAVGGGPITRLDVALDDIKLRFIRNIAEHACLCAATEQRALRTFENLDALEVGRIDIEVTARQLRGLVVEINGDVREAAGGAAALIATAADAEPAHKDLALSR